MLLSRLVELVHQVRGTPRKTEKAALIADLLRETSGRDASLAALYLSGTLPQGRIGVGWRTLAAVSADAPAEGTPLTLADVDAGLGQIETATGAGSAARREAFLREILARAEPAERRFLNELLMGEVRQGALEGVVMDAIARAAEVKADAVRGAAMFAPNLGEVAAAALAEGASGLARFQMRLLAPIAPMLASPAADVAEAIERMGEAAFEYKVDGARVQVHKAGDTVRIFTRQLQEVTARVPEIVEWTRALPARDVVFDGEAIALRPDGRPHPFQVTMRRFGRAKEIEALRQTLPLTVFPFDLLYDAETGPLLTSPYSDRAARLARLAPADSMLPRIVTGDRAAADAFLAQALADGHEGVMAKALDAPYAAGQRGFAWLKLKSAQTLDLVVLAAEWGSGRRKGWLSNLHLGARDPGTGSFVMLGKTFKGLTDAMLRDQTEALLALATRQDDWVVHVRPERVVEIAFNDIQESPRYPGGLALRFARVKRYREDKTAAEADTIATVRALFEAARR